MADITYRHNILNSTFQDHDWLWLNEAKPRSFIEHSVNCPNFVLCFTVAHRSQIMGMCRIFITNICFSDSRYLQVKRLNLVWVFNLPENSSHLWATVLKGYTEQWLTQLMSQLQTGCERKHLRWRFVGVVLNDVNLISTSQDNTFMRNDSPKPWDFIDHKINVSIFVLCLTLCRLVKEGRPPFYELFFHIPCPLQVG